jgi:hypothetical protein
MGGDWSQHLVTFRSPLLTRTFGTRARQPALLLKIRTQATNTDDIGLAWEVSAIGCAPPKYSKVAEGCPGIDL